MALNWRTPHRLLIDRPGSTCEFSASNRFEKNKQIIMLEGLSFLRVLKLFYALNEFKSMQIS